MLLSRINTTEMNRDERLTIEAINPVCNLLQRSYSIRIMFQRQSTESAVGEGCARGKGEKGGMSAQGPQWV